MLTKNDLVKGEILVSPNKNGGSLSFIVETLTQSLIADEPQELGGGDMGMSPFEFLASSLATCTAMTLRFYAKHKGFELGDFQVKVSSQQIIDPVTGQKIYTLTRHLAFADEIEETMLLKYEEIAEKCPVHKTLQGQMKIITESSAKK